MKTLYFFLSLLIVSFSLSGCALKGTFDNSYISKDINPYFSKVTQKEVHLDIDSNVISKSPESMSGKLSTVSMETGNINKQIAESFFKQYFQQVDFKKDSVKDFRISSHVKDYTYSYGRFGHSSTVKITLDIEVYYNDKNILTKTYIREFNDSVIYNIATIHASENLIELFHRSLLIIYETEFKKDLLEVL